MEEIQPLYQTPRDLEMTLIHIVPLYKAALMLGVIGWPIP
jgi:hypothetical protein